MVIAVFALVIANLFISFPSSVIPVNFEIIIALIFGTFINKRGISLTIPSILAQAMLFFMIYLGTIYPVSLSGLVGAGNELMVWMVFYHLQFYRFCFTSLASFTTSRLYQLSSIIFRTDINVCWCLCRDSNSSRSGA